VNNLKNYVFETEKNGEIAMATLSKKDKKDLFESIPLKIKSHMRLKLKNLNELRHEKIESTVSYLDTVKGYLNDKITKMFISKSASAKKNKPFLNDKI
jgi:hypothetical protein